MVIERPEKIMKINALNFDCIRHKWCKINKKVNILVQSTHSFARIQTKSSLLIFHFKSKYCLVVQHRKHGTETKGDTGIRVTRHCSTRYSDRKYLSSYPYINGSRSIFQFKPSIFSSYRIPQTFQHERK